MTRFKTISKVSVSCVWPQWCYWCDNDKIWAGRPTWRRVVYAGKCARNV